MSSTHDEVKLDLRVTARWDGAEGVIVLTRARSESGARGGESTRLPWVTTDYPGP